jgi:hypothetical protein
MGSERRAAILERITGDLIASLRIASNKAELKYPQEAHVVLANK